ncbi:hypothetical protein VFPPC_12681 [Pochonia chlamydosporia 170]|uniref:Uncharacterized protein n=1 Tax=Pochonia chlamydosporia 170 TaxID=1380566 RepID=A0A179G2A0_METCM|nr:hypothetical protein VFPPC_12681 [Pochonia chlamydosporia 170]OAQ71982.1 hypothetical protein VFPPC_12681 [Pochonia chlamydosporia 170]
MLIRDTQRLALAIVLTVVLLYTSWVYFARGRELQDLVPHGADDSVNDDKPPYTPPNIPIPLPHPDADPIDDSTSQEIALQEPQINGNDIAHRTEGINQGENTMPPLQEVVN